MKLSPIQVKFVDATNINLKVTSKVLVLQEGGILWNRMLTTTHIVADNGE